MNDHICTLLSHAYHMCQFCVSRITLSDSDHKQVKGGDNTMEVLQVNNVFMWKIFLDHVLNDCDC